MAACKLAGGIAHDFNNVLTVILGFGEMVAKDLDPGSRAAADMEEVLRAGRRAATLVGQLLAFSRKQVLQPRVLDLNATVGEMGKMLLRVIREDIRLVTVPAPDLGRVEAAASDHPGMAPGRYVMLSVSDTGVGMDPQTLSRVFEPFFSTKPKGQATGLGLATVYGIVSQSGGFVEVDSEPGRGATFRIYLPQTDEKAVPGEREPTAEAPGGTETILLAEDEGAVREALDA